ncbi:MAG: YybH family protein [bacterium]
MDKNTIAREWLTRFEDCVRGCDFSKARGLFSAAVVGYGSLVGRMTGLDALEGEQWRQVWPNIRQFTFQLGDLRVHGSEEMDLLALAVSWNSVGINQAQGPFERPGRCTLLLKREEDGAWLCAHSHFSLMPGVPQTFQ